MRSPTRPPRVFPGWWVVTGVFVMLFTTAGLGFYGLAVYLRALVLEQGFSVGQVSGATAVFFLVSGVTGLPVAALLARRDPRPLVAGGALLAGGALAVLGRVEEVWQVYLVYALFGAGFAASSLVPGTTLVTRWFSRRRALALSVASTGLSAGGVALTPAVSALIDRHGLATVAPWAGLALVLGVVPVTTLLLRPSPEQAGLRPDGDPPPAGRDEASPELPHRAATPGAVAPGAVAPEAPAPEAPAPEAPAPQAPAPEALPGVLAVEALRTRFFAAVTVGHLLAMLAQVGGIAHLFNLVGERFDPAAGRTALSLLAVSSLAGRLVGGVVAARTSQRGMALVLMVVQALTLVLLPVLPGRTAVLVCTVAFGLTVGNLLMLHPLLLAERFGVRDYGRIYSRSQVVATLGVAAGPAVLGLMHDALGGYGAAFGVAAAASAVAAVVLATSGSTRGAPAPATAPA